MPRPSCQSKKSSGDTLEIRSSTPSSVRQMDRIAVGLVSQQRAEAGVCVTVKRVAQACREVHPVDITVSDPRPDVRDAPTKVYAVRIAPIIGLPGALPRK